ncbi:putative membrane protein [Opitutaceae bacterium TAV1]|nr:putative membrane protein [Opitutaceae bacterium TAV1]
MKNRKHTSPAPLAPLPPSVHPASVRVELLISEVLRWGVWISLALLAIGTLLCFAYSHDYGPGGGTAADLRRLIVSEEAFPRTLAWLGEGLAHLRGQAIIVLGLLLLIATPVVRVIISIGGFVMEKDRLYVMITSIVLLLLLVSFVLGKAG